MLNTALGLETGLSNLLTGVLVDKAGYDAGFLMLSAIATTAIAVFWLKVPETKIIKQRETVSS